MSQIGDTMSKVIHYSKLWHAILWKINIDQEILYDSCHLPSDIFKLFLSQSTNRKKDQLDNLPAN